MGRGEQKYRFPGPRSGPGPDPAGPDPEPVQPGPEPVPNFDTRYKPGPVPGIKISEPEPVPVPSV